MLDILKFPLISSSRSFSSNYDCPSSSVMRSLHIGNGIFHLLVAAILCHANPVVPARRQDAQPTPSSSEESRSVTSDVVSRTGSFWSFSNETVTTMISSTAVPYTYGSKGTMTIQTTITSTETATDTETQLPPSASSISASEILTSSASHHSVSASVMFTKYNTTVVASSTPGPPSDAGGAPSTTESPTGAQPYTTTEHASGPSSSQQGSTMHTSQPTMSAGKSSEISHHTATNAPHASKNPDGKDLIEPKRLVQAHDWIRNCLHRKFVQTFRSTTVFQGASTVVLGEVTFAC